MKKLTLVACAAGLVAGGLATVAQAGQIQASSTNYAREAVVSDTTKVALPVVSYKLLGSVGSTTQPTNFSMTVDLDSGDYDTTAGNVTTPGMVYIRDQNLAATVAVPFTANTVTVSGKKMTVTFVIPANALNVYPNPIVVFNQLPVAGAVANTGYNAPVPVTGDGKVVNLFTGAGLAMLDCTISTKFVNAIVKHFNAAGVEDDSTRSGNTNTAVVLGFPTTHAAVVTANGTAGTLDVTNSNKTFVAGGAGGTMQFTAGAGAISATQALLGRVDLVGAATGYAGNVAPTKPAGLLAGLDANGAAAYTTGAVTATNVGAVYTTIVGTQTPHAAAAALINGPVEVAGFKVDVTADQGMVVGGTLFLSPTSNCAGVFGGATTTITAASGAAGFVNTLTSALGTANTTSVYVCYTVPNTVLVPSSGFRAVATVLKSSGASGEQNNISCAAPLASLGGSLKIDVRNYVPAARSAVAGGWTSVLRLINNSEVNTVRVFAQTIDSAGNFGRSALIKTLAPRAAEYMLNSQIDGLLAGSTGSAATNAISANLVGNGTDTNNTRLRITAEGSDTLRVQNYLVGPQGQFVEASGAQGVDLANGQVANRAGDSGSLLDQDAQRGLNGQ